MEPLATQRQYFKLPKSDGDPTILKIPKNVEYYFGKINAPIEVVNDYDEFDGCNFHETYGLDPDFAAQFQSDFWRDVYETLTGYGVIKEYPNDRYLTCTNENCLDWLGDYTETSFIGSDEFKPSWEMFDGLRRCNKITGPKTLKEAVAYIIILRAKYLDYFSIMPTEATMSEIEFQSWTELWDYAFYNTHADCPHCVTPYKISTKLEGKPRAVAVINFKFYRMTFSERVPGEYYFSYSWTE